MEQIAPLQYARPLTRFFIFMSLVLVSVAFSEILGNIITAKYFSLDMHSGQPLEEQLKESADAIRGLKLIQAFSQLIGLIMPALFFARLVNVDVYEELKFTNRSLALSYILISLIIVIVMPFVNFLGWLNSMVDFGALFGEQMAKLVVETEERANAILQLFIYMPTVQSLLGVLLIIGILAPIGEELVFRGVFQKIFTALFKNVHVGVWSTAILFSFFHFQFFGFLPRMFLGAVLGYAFVYSRTIWVPIVGHAVNNSLTVLVYYFGWDKTESIANPNTIGVGNSQIIIAIISLLIAGALMFVLRKKEVEDKGIPEIELPLLPPMPKV